MRVIAALVSSAERRVKYGGGKRSFSYPGAFESSHAQTLKRRQSWISHYRTNRRAEASRNGEFQAAKGRLAYWGFLQAGTAKSCRAKAY